MEWTRSDTIGLALLSCRQCNGGGLRPTRGKRMTVCNCVLRAIFRACLERYYELRETPHRWAASFERATTHRRPTWGIKSAEYCADFELVARRHLDPWHHRVFRLHFIRGLDWRECCPIIRTDRGNFYHAIYRIEERLGRVFRELKPYSLFPLDEYFNAVNRAPEPWMPAEQPRNGRCMLYPPLRRLDQPVAPPDGDSLQREVACAALEAWLL
jgi:hypothetical protein